MSDTAETIAVPLYSSAQASIPALLDPESEAAADETAGNASEPPLERASSASTDGSVQPKMSLKDAVLNCRKAYKQAFAAAKASGASDHAAEKRGSAAYCASMPLLTSEGNICAFMACVGHAMAVDMIRKSDGLQLITAARAALLCVPLNRNPPGRQRRNFQAP